MTARGVFLCADGANILPLFGGRSTGKICRTPLHSIQIPMRHMTDTFVRKITMRSVGDDGLAAARSRSGYESHLGFHSTPSRRFATRAFRVKIKNLYGSPSEKIRHSTNLHSNFSMYSRRQQATALQFNPNFCALNSAFSYRLISLAKTDFDQPIIVGKIIF